MNILNFIRNKVIHNWIFCNIHLELVYHIIIIIMEPEFYVGWPNYIEVLWSAFEMSFHILTVDTYSS